MIKDLRNQNQSLQRQVERLMEDLRNVYISNHNQNDSFRSVELHSSKINKNSTTQSILDFRRTEEEKEKLVEKVSLTKIWIYEYRWTKFFNLKILIA